LAADQKEAMPNLLKFQVMPPWRGESGTARAPRLVILAMVAAFLLGLPFLNARYLVQGPIYAASVTATTLFTVLAAVVLCAQYYVERRPLWGALAFAYVFQAVVSMLWVVGYPMLTLSPVFDQDRSRMLVWLWFCRNVTLPVLLLIGLRLESKARATQRRAYDQGATAQPVLPEAPILTLAWPVLAAFAAFFGFSVLSHWLPANINVPSDTLAGHLATGALVLGHLVVVIIATRRRYSDGVIAFIVTFVAFAHLMKILCVLLLSPDAVYGWYMVGAWALVGPFSVVGALLWRGVEALRKARIDHRRLVEIASTDPLTKLFNRVYFDDSLAQCAGARQTFSLLLLDVDYFKSINDRFGHPVGDQVLRELAKVVLPCIRSSEDFVARIGGEEFAVVLPGADESAARRVAERIRLAVETHANFAPAVVLTHPVTLTVSIGMVTARTGEPVDSLRLIDAADRALYRSKAAGRNRVTVAPWAPTSFAVPPATAMPITVPGVAAAAAASVSAASAVSSVVDLVSDPQADPVLGSAGAPS
jgi:diguanylate cyclase (GGDEF)-like protein